MIYGPQPLTEEDQKRWAALVAESERLAALGDVEGNARGVENGPGAGLSGKMPLPHGRKSKDYWWNN